MYQIDEWLHSLHPPRMGPCSRTWTFPVNEIDAIYWPLLPERSDDDDDNDDDGDNDGDD